MQRAAAAGLKISDDQGRRPGPGRAAVGPEWRALGGRPKKLLAAGTALGMILSLAPGIVPVQASPAATIFNKGKNGDEGEPVLLRADKVTYDRDLGVVTAHGHVELSQAGRILLADMVTYNERADTVSASGNVSIMEPTGEVLFGDYMELTDQMRNGFIKGVSALLTDNSRAAGTSARRTGGNRTVLENAVYSPCDLCKDDKDSAPLWQLRAKQVIHDQQKQRIEYKDATLDFFGIPIAYTPYFSHYDPTVKRASGFLVPSFGNDQNLGTIFELPYYYAISPSRDLTVTPVYTTNQGAVLKGLYRERTANGRFQLDASITQTDQVNDANQKTGAQQIRGHIRGAGRFNLDNTWRWGFDLARATDDTYMRLYRLSRADNLTSNIFVEGIRNRSYASASAYSFQGLLAQDSPGLTPVPLPVLEYNYVGNASKHGGYYTLDASALGIYRSKGTDTRRLSTTFGWTNNVIAPAGDIYTLRAELRGDFYSISEGIDQTGAVSQSGTDARALPLVSVRWSYPFVRSSGTVQQLIEPIVMGVLTPYGGNHVDIIPNEDSRNFELDDTNLFANNRFPGLDRYESGPRVAYGIHGALYGLSGGYSDFLFGQSIRSRADTSIPVDTGLESRISDYVGRLTIAPSPLFDVTHRFRMDHNNMRLHRNEVITTFGPQYLRLSLGYARLDRELSTNQFGRREEVSVSTFMQLTRSWRVAASWVHDTIQGGGAVNTQLGLRYIDECFDVNFTAARNNIRDRDVQPSTSFKVVFKLKNLG